MSWFKKAIGGISAGRVARGSAVALCARIAAIALGFLQSLVLARALGPEGYGTLAIVVSATAVAGAAAAYGLQSLAVREIAQLVVRDDLSTLRTFVAWCGLLAFAGSLGAGALVVGGGWAASGPPELIWCLVLTPMVAFLMLFRGISQGFGAVFAALAPLDVIRPGIVVVVFVVAWAASLKPDVTDAILIVVCATALAMMLALSLLLTRLRRLLHVAGAPVPARRWLSGAASFFAIGVLAALQAEYATILIGFLAGEREAGLFQPAFRLAAVLQVARQAIEIPLAPRISALRERGDDVGLQTVVRKAAIWAGTTGLVGWIVLLLEGEAILALFGDQYTASAPALYAMASAHLVFICCGPVTTLLNMTGHQASTLRALGTSLLVSAVLGVWWIPLGGAFGGAASFSIGFVLYSGLLLKEVRTRLDVNPTVLPLWRAA